MSVCLFGIYRLERKITRLLDSVLGLVDCLFILDTGLPGEEDLMTPLIEEWTSLHQIPCRIERRPFDDFGSSRSESLWRAKEVFPESKWFLTLDADMILRSHKPLEEVKQMLSESEEKGFSLLQESGDNKWYNLRIFSREHLWECRGVTHEYWTIPGEEFYGTFLPDLFIEDVADGATRGEKLSRDKRLLETALRLPSILEKSLLGRYVFYQALTHKNLGLLKDAYHLFVRRIGIDTENRLEKYYAFLEAASTLRDMSLVQTGEKRNRLLQNAIGFYSAACTFHPSQADAYYNLGILYLEFFPTPEGRLLAERVAFAGFLQRNTFTPANSLFYSSYKSVYGLPFILAQVYSFHPEGGKLNEMGKKHKKFLMDHLEDLPKAVAKRVQTL